MQGEQILKYLTSAGSKTNPLPSMAPTTRGVLMRQTMVVLSTLALNPADKGTVCVFVILSSASIATEAVIDCL